jgi:hypothetical protein
VSPKEIKAYQPEERRTKEEKRDGMGGIQKMLGWSRLFVMYSRAKIAAASSLFIFIFFQEKVIMCRYNKKCF